MDPTLRHNGDVNAPPSVADQSHSMCSSPHWQVGLSWFREKLSSVNRDQRLSRWADYAKNCLPRIGSKELRDFVKNIALLGAKKWGSTCDRDISNCAIYMTAIYRGYTVSIARAKMWIGKCHTPIPQRLGLSACIRRVMGLSPYRSILFSTS